MILPPKLFACLLSVLTLSAAAFSQNIYTINNSPFYGSGSTQEGSCSGTAGSQTLTSCGIYNPPPSGSDFVVGEGIRIIGGGNASTTASFSVVPIVTKNSPGGQTGGHTYCYVVSAADPLGGISAAYPSPTLTPPSPSSLPKNCVANEPAVFSVTTVFNTVNLGGVCPVMGTATTLLWYVADLSAPAPAYKLFNVSGTPGGNRCPYNASATDLSQASTFGTRGGWPASPLTQAKNEDFFTIITAINGGQVSIQDKLPQTFNALTIAHDDTNAVQQAIAAAAQAGGGVVQFGNGTYNLFRPRFLQDRSNYPTFGISAANAPTDAGYSYLQIPNGAIGNIYIAGIGSYSSTGNTTINTPPDAGQWAHFIAIGAYGGPCCSSGAPAYGSPSSFKIFAVAKGDTKVTLTTTSSSFKVNDDIWLYSGSFGPNPSSPCPDPAANGPICHYSELNTVASISNDAQNHVVLGLTTPASKAFYQDSYGDTFGLVKLPVTPHNISLEHMTLNTFDPVLAQGVAYGITVTGVLINNPVGGGPFGGGPKRDMVIENSTWSFGAGDDNTTYAGTDEFDQFTNVKFLNNTITGYATSEVEGSGNGTRIVPTEGSSQFTFTGNTFNKVSVLIAQTTDDVFKTNQFNDGYISVGTTYSLSTNCLPSGKDLSHLSFASTAALDIESNTFSIAGDYQAPYVIQAGAFSNATIANNTITFGGSYPYSPNVISSGSGNITGNIISVTQNADNSSLPEPGSAFCLQPSTTNATSPAAGAIPISVSNNTVSGSQIYDDVRVADPGFVSPPVSCSKNKFNSNVQTTIVNVNPNNSSVNCTP